MKGGREAKKKEQMRKLRVKLAAADEMAGKAYNRTFTGDVNTSCICLDEIVQGDDCV